MPALAAYFLKHTAGLRYSITAHAWDIYKDTTMLRRKMDAAEFVVTCTAANRDYLRTNIGSTAPVLLSYHGVDFSRVPLPLFERSSRPKILAVGRLVEQKGFVHLVEACRLLKEKGRDLDCQIIGEGPLRVPLTRQIDQRGLRQNVTLAGSQPLAAVFAAYREATALCVPSVVASDGDRDGIPNVIIEAMSQGLPVVASSVSGIPEIVRERSGWPVNSGDVPALVRALEDVVDDVEEARRRAVVAYHLVRDQFDSRKNAALLLDQFRGVVC
jgi:glycosyltransferase involved in cell wall biosynthesis